MAGPAASWQSYSRCFDTIGNSMPLHRRSFLALSLLLGAAGVVRAQPSATRYTTDQVRADLRFIEQAIAATHPDPGFSTDPAKLQAAYRDIAAQLRAPLTRDQVWRLLATLNPVFADAHLAITMPDGAGQCRTLFDGGGALFPYEVVVDAGGAVTIRAELGGGASELAGMAVNAINGMPAQRVAAELLARCHGDTPAFRASLLAMRWSFLYWKMFGAPTVFELTTADGRTLRVAAAAHLPAYLAAQAQFDRQFALRLLPDQAALLTLGTFAWPDKQQFLAFMAQSFTRIREHGVRTLLIDVRDNGGGNDDFWIDGLLRYIADKPYRWASGYKKKVIAGRTSPGEPLGAVIDGTIDKWVQPALSEALRFKGASYLLVGSNTYSSAILLANVMQDFGFGKLVGAAGVARVRQSGGTQNFVLPNTGLALGVPRLIFNRPSAALLPDLLQPDIVLPDSPLDRQQLVDAVLKLA